MKAKRYIRSAEIEAIQWNGNNYGDISDFLEGKCYTLNRCLFVETASGTIPSNISDYICKDDENIRIIPKKVFQETFEEVY